MSAAYGVSSDTSYTSLPQEAAEAKACLLQMAESFDGVTASRHLAAAPAFDSQPDDCAQRSSPWQLRVQRLEHACGNDSATWQPHPERDSNWAWQNLFETYPWGSSAQGKTVTLWTHPIFARPFSAVCPDALFIFAAPRSLAASDPLAAAQIVHEFAHIDEGARLGWEAFQKRSPEEVETPALLAEKQFLQTILAGTEPEVSWEKSPLRLEWNRSYRATSWRDLNEALLYLRIMETIDPI